MTVSDETLMAYADGEVDAATRTIVEAAMRDDPEIRRRIAQHRALREAVRGAFSEVLDEPVPQRLIAAAHGAPAGNVVDLAGARDAAASKAPRRGLRSWQPAAMAASLLLGLALGYLGWRGSNTLVRISSNGELLAGAGLAEALSGQLSADHSPGLVATTSLSFRAKTGDYCRTFSLHGTDANSGLACREGGSWKIKVLAQSPQTSANSAAFRPAASADSPAVRAAVEASIDGEPLDHAGEIAARQGNWSASR
jgi:anti-sigma factor ChrR (cupin superfamily)